MYSDYSNRYLGLDPNLGGSANIPTPFMSRAGLPYANNFALPQIMAGNVSQPQMAPIQPDSTNTTMMRMLNFMLISKQLENSEGSSSSFKDYESLLSLLPMGSNNGMSSLFGMMSLMAQFDMLDNDNSAKRNNKSINKKDIKVRDLSPEFLEKVKKISDELNCDSSDLLAVMYAESRLDSTAVNDKPIRTKDGRTLPPTNATGLIQFMPQTAKEFDTNIYELKRMTPEKQLDYVEKYLKKLKKDRGFGDRSLSGADLYALVFLPARSKRDVLTSEGESYYDSNPGLDVNNNGRITKSDLEKIVQGYKKTIFSD